MRLRTTTSAARELGMSQPAVSNVIKRAETQLGFRLFDRISNRLIQTEEARILFADAEPLFLMHQAIQQKARDLRTGRTGLIRLFATSEVSESLMPKVLRRFVVQHPQVKISLNTVPLDTLLEGVEMGIADLGIAMDPRPRPGLTYEPLLELEMVCVCPQDSAIGNLPFVTPGDIRGERLICSPTGNRVNFLIAEAFRTSKEPFSPIIEVLFMNVARRLVESGLGVAIVDELSATYNGHPDLLIRAFKPCIPLTIYGILPKDRPPQRLAQSFLKDAHIEIGSFRRPHL